MTITIDNISCLFFLMIKGELQDPPSIVTKEDDIGLVVYKLGVPFEEATIQVRACRGAY